MDKQEIIDWLCNGDISIRYQAKRDLQDSNDRALQKIISSEGWVKSYY